MAFFLSTDYNFKTKSWMSGRERIPKNVWAESSKHENQFPVLNDKMMFLYSKDLWLVSFRSDIGPYDWDKELNESKKEWSSLKNY